MYRDLDLRFRLFFNKTKKNQWTPLRTLIYHIVLFQNVSETTTPPPLQW